MRYLILLVAVMSLLVPPALAQEQPDSTPDSAEYRRIILNRCTGCHGVGRIEQAMAEGRNVEEILEKMARMAKLSEREKDVLGIFWGSPLKEEK